MVLDASAEPFADLVMSVSIVWMLPADTVVCAEFVGLDDVVDPYTADFAAE